MHRPFFAPFARPAFAGMPGVHTHTPDEPGHEGHEHGPRGHGHRGRRGPGFGGFGRGFGGPGFGPRGGPGFGPGGPGFGPGGPGFGPGGPGGPGFGPGPWKQRRGRRGNVRAAILALLAEEPRHGYSIMNELAERSGGLWRPSPGSVYPVLSQLQDEGLVSATDADGRRVFSLTDAGREHVAENAEALREPWVVADDGPRRRVGGLMQAMAGLGAAVEQVARLGDDAQAARAVEALDEARRTMYRLLAGDEPASSRGQASEPSTGLSDEPSDEPSGEPPAAPYGTPE